MLSSTNALENGANALTGQRFTEERITDMKNTKTATIAQGKLPMSTDVLLKDEERTKCSVYSRVMGYFSPTTLWNHGKKEEWVDRRKAFFVEPTMDEMDKLKLNRKEVLSGTAN